MINRTIHSLRQRPHDERRAVALLSSIGVMAVLTVAWGFSFSHEVRTYAARGNESVPAATAASPASAQTAAAAAIVPTSSVIPVPAEQNTLQDIPQDTPSGYIDISTLETSPTIAPAPASAGAGSGDSAARQLQEALR